MAPALLVDDLGKRYGRVRALEGVSLEVQSGELVGLLGPNGGDALAEALRTARRRLPHAFLSFFRAG